MKTKYIEIMDTTLRDGEQTKGISFNLIEKLKIAEKLLQEVKVDRIEIASARVSEGEKNTCKKILDWAKKNNFQNKIEILGFVDDTQSVDWLFDVGCVNLNLLTKGSLKHLTNQLKKTPEEHIKDIKKVYNYAKSIKINVNVYLEDWSNGMIHSRDYVFFMIDELIKIGIKRIMLPDTLGILHPDQTYEFIKMIIEKYKDIKFDFHGHNDYGLATANSLAAVKAGISAVHCTVNGLGERAGNAPLDEVVVGINDFYNFKTNLKENKFKEISKLVEKYSGKRIAFNKPITGENVFVQTAGIHADGDKKGNLYANNLLPERFGQERHYALGKLSGKANLQYNLKKLKINLTKEEEKLVLKKIIELGDIKKEVTIDDLPFIISDVLNTPRQKIFEIKNCVIVSGTGISPTASITFVYKNKEYQAVGSGDGGYDAFMNALRTIAPKLKIIIPKLEDYEVRIPPGGKTNALVETKITWANGMQTIGVKSDQVMAAIEATEKMLNRILS